MGSIAIEPVLEVQENAHWLPREETYKTIRRGPVPARAFQTITAQLVGMGEFLVLGVRSDMDDNGLLWLKSINIQEVSTFYPTQSKDLARQAGHVTPDQPQ